MDLPTVDWLNEEFIRKVLKNYEEDESITVDKITISPATAKGDNYSSDMIRVGVEYLNKKRKTEKKSLIVKISPTVEGIRKDMVMEIGSFDREIQMMERTLKEMNKLVGENGYRLGADILFAKVGDPSLLVLEDLAALGFRMADRQAGLDLDHSMLALRGLAKFHASSVALCEKKPQHVALYRDGVFHADSPDDIKKFFVEGLKTLSREVSEWTEFGTNASIYAEKLEKIAEACWSKTCDCMGRNDDEFNVINHGDFWVNNMLFRYNEHGKVIDHIFVDFQLCVYTTPAIDLQYFLNTSVADDVDVKYRNVLLEEYLSTLGKTMSKLGCKTQPPSMETLKKNMETRSFFGVIAACNVLPLVLIDKDKVMSIDEMMPTDGSFINPAYKGALFRKVMVRKIPEWNAQGLLNV